MKPYDYLIVGAGITGATLANLLRGKGKKCLVLEKRDHIAGNLYDVEINGIRVHRYGAHIFHTSDRRVWEYVNRFAEFNHFINSPVANYRGEVYNLPFNMNTFSRLWGVFTPEEARAEIRRQQLKLDHEPRNLEEQGLSLAGRDVFEKLIKGYTEKQWGRPCRELPAFILRRVPFRFKYDNNYFSDPYQGIPVDGYTAMVRRMLEGVEVRCGAEYLARREDWNALAETVLYTGTIDSYFDYAEGHLAYRTLRFEDEAYDIPNYQGVAVVNYTAAEVPYTRIIEHKHFVFGEQPNTIITKEYPAEWKDGAEPYYAINDEKNLSLLKRYQARARALRNVCFCGRLGEYKYYDMDQAIAAAFDLAQKL